MCFILYCKFYSYKQQQQHFIKNRQLQGVYIPTRKYLKKKVLSKKKKSNIKKSIVSFLGLRWPNTVCARFTDSVSDAIKRTLGLWYVNMADDKVIPQFHMKWIIKVSFNPK